MNNFGIRRGRYADIECIVSIVKDVIPLMQASGNYQWDENYPTKAHFVKDVEENQLWVVEETSSGAVVGVAALTTDQPAEFAHAGCDLSLPAIVPHRMAVSPEYQGNGIGAMLIDHAEVLAREAGYNTVRIDTNESNKAMQRVLQKNNYIFMSEFLLDGKSDGLIHYCYEKKLQKKL
jgi:ribosomal protein S18 acetylase RimI-like enzyme